MTSAELVHHAAKSFATGKFTNGSPGFPSKIIAQIERLYRSVYLLATLKREGMVREGHREELKRITEAARELQVSIMKEASG